MASRAGVGRATGQDHQKARNRFYGKILNRAGISKHAYVYEEVDISSEKVVSEAHQETECGRRLRLEP